MLKQIATIMISIIFSAGVSLAAHPLISDDAGTMGKRNYLFETNYEHSNDDSQGTKTTVNKIQLLQSIGVTDEIDLVIGLPYQFINIKTDGDSNKEDGFSDISLEIKWRFYEKEGLSFALKPGVLLPTGDDKKGLGSGKMGASLFFIATKEIEPCAFHFNLGYRMNENNHDLRKDIWHLSIAAERELGKWVKAVVNVGGETNPDKESNTQSTFVLGGLIFPVAKNLDLSVGIKRGLSGIEPDYSVLAGIGFSF